MRKILISGLLLGCLYSQAQDPVDALRFSRFTATGSARSLAIGGAMTGLGGDISAVNSNPAGIAMFKTSELVLSPGFNFLQNKSTYLDGRDKGRASEFNYGMTGFIIATPPNRSGPWRNFTYAVTASRTADFNNQMVFKGRNNRSSYSEKYLEELINAGEIDPNRAASEYPFGPSLAVNTYLVEPELDAQGNATGYFSMATPLTGLQQEQVVKTTGGISTVSFAGSGNLSDKLYLGASLNLETVKFTREQTFKESDASGNTKNNFNYFTVEDYLNTSGAGLNLKAGLIFKPVDYIRMGVSVHTPTFYDLSDRYNTTITTDLEGYAGAGTLKQSTADLIGQFAEYAYQFYTPWKFAAGLSYVLREEEDVTKQRGFLTADVEFLNYGNGRFADPDNPGNGYFDDLNNVVGQQFQNALNVRVGGELKFNTIMTRAGFGYYGNPYTDTDINGSRMTLSGGLGWRNKGKFIDLTYMHHIVKDGYYPYRLNDNFFAPVNLRGGGGNVLLTFGFKF